MASRRELGLDLSALGRSELRDVVRRTLEELGYGLVESHFRAGMHGGHRPTATLVAGDLFRIAGWYTEGSPEEWTAFVRSRNPYFLAFVRTRRDERCADLVDDLVRHSDLRLKVCRGDAPVGELRRCVAEAAAALEPEAVVDARVPSSSDRLRVEFADGLVGEVTWERLGIDERTRKRLVLRSATVGSGSRTVDLLTREGERFEIDSAAVRAILDPAFAGGVDEATRRSERAVGKRIRAARETAGMTQTALADRIGVDQAVISRLERGRHRPRLDTLTRVAKGLGLDIAELLAS